MLHTRKQFLFLVLSFLGVGSLLVLYFAQDILAYLDENDEDVTLLAEGNSCPLGSADYMHTLQNQSGDEDPFVVGCGGIF